MAELTVAKLLKARELMLSAEKQIPNDAGLFYGPCPECGTELDSYLLPKLWDQCCMGYLNKLIEQIDAPFNAKA